MHGTVTVQRDIITSNRCNIEQEIVVREISKQFESIHRRSNLPA